MQPRINYISAALVPLLRSLSTFASPYGNSHATRYVCSSHMRTSLCPAGSPPATSPVSVRLALSRWWLSPFPLFFCPSQCYHRLLWTVGDLAFRFTLCGRGRQQRYLDSILPVLGNLVRFPRWPMPVHTLLRLSLAVLAICDMQWSIGVSLEKYHGAFITV